MTLAEQRVIEIAKQLCATWDEQERRWLHVAVDGTDIKELRDAVNALEPQQVGLGI